MALDWDFPEEQWSGKIAGVLWQHEDIRGPISTKYETILSLQDCSVLLSFLYQNKTRFDLKEVMDSVAGATGWVWGIGIQTLAISFYELV